MPKKFVPIQQIVSSLVKAKVLHLNAKPFSIRNME